MFSGFSGLELSMIDRVVGMYVVFSITGLGFYACIKIGELVEWIERRTG